MSFQTALAQAAPGGVAASHDGPDAWPAAWDRFVEAAPGGDLVQTSVWAQAKRALGLQICPVVASSGREILGGALIVIKRYAALGGLGFIARGPLVAAGRSGQAVEVLRVVERAA